MLKNLENNGTEEIVLVTPTPEAGITTANWCCPLIEKLNRPSHLHFEIKYVAYVSYYLLPLVKFVQTLFPRRQIVRLSYCCFFGRNMYNMIIG